MSSGPTDFEGCRCFMALRRSDSQTDAKDELEDQEAIEESCRSGLLKTLVITVFLGP